MILLKIENLFSKILNDLKIKQPLNGISDNIDKTLNIANNIGYPVLIRPSYVLGGRAMEIAYDDNALKSYMLKMRCLYLLVILY